jgi:hypothetical protein
MRPHQEFPTHQETEGESLTVSRNLGLQFPYRAVGDRWQERNGDTLDVHSTTRMGFRISAVATPEHQVFLVSDQETDPPEIGTAILLSAMRFVREIENERR